jgi:hypothetical protein
MRRMVTVLLLAILAIVSSAHIVNAQDTLEVPPPSGQNQPNMPPRQQPPPRPQWTGPSEDAPIQLLPPQWFAPQPRAPIAPPPVVSRPVPTNPPPMNPMTTQNTPALPETFRGCWQGEVSQLDWIRREPGGRKVGFWTPKTYRLCYKRVGNGPFKLTFTETGIAPSEKIINPRGHVVPISTDGRAFATMRARLRFDEYSSGRNAAGSTFAVDEITNLDCRINGDQMLVTADVFGSRDGVPWFRAHWRAEFHHFPG